MYKGKWITIPYARVRMRGSSLEVLTDDLEAYLIPSSVLEKLKEQEWEADQQDTKRK